MSSKKSDATVATDLGSEQVYNTIWPSLGASVSRSRGSSSQLKSGQEVVKNLDKEGIPDVTDIQKSQISSNPGEFPSNQIKKDPPSYSAAVGVGNVETPMFVTEEKGEKIGIIPDEMIGDDIKPLWSDLLVGKFPSKAPKLKDIFFTVNKIWTLGDRNIKIEVYQVSDTLIKFRITDKHTRDKILRRGMWSIHGLPMILSKWAPIEELEAMELKMVPIWITISNVPRSLFHWKVLSYISKVVGKPIKLHPETVQCVKFDEAKIQVEADINAQRPTSHKFISSANGTFTVDFLYPWIPSRCSRCFKWGHSSDSCSGMNGKNIQIGESNNVEENREGNNLEPEQSLDKPITDVSPSSLLRKRNQDEDSSKVVTEDPTVEKEEQIQEVMENSSQSNKKEGSYSKVTGKMIITNEDALEELRMVKEGLRQVNSHSHVQMVGRKDGLEENKEEEVRQYTERYHRNGSPIINSSIKQLKGKCWFENLLQGRNGKQFKRGKEVSKKKIWKEEQVSLILLTPDMLY